MTSACREKKRGIRGGMEHATGGGEASHGVVTAANHGFLGL